MQALLILAFEFLFNEIVAKIGLKETPLSDGRPFDGTPTMDSTKQLHVG